MKQIPLVRRLPAHNAVRGTWWEVLGVFALLWAVPGMANAQYCTYNGPVCFSPNPFIDVYFTGYGGVFQESDLPLTSQIDLTLNGIPAGGLSGPTLNYVPLTYGGGIPLPLTYEGQDLVLNSAWSMASLITPASVSGTCGPANFYYDAIEPLMFNWSSQVVDCAAGTFRVVLTDNAAEAGNITSADRAAAVNYQLRRNGVLIASGSLASVFVASPASFVFDGLIAGAHLLTLTDANASDAKFYCPNTADLDFVVPNALDCGTSLALRAALEGASPVNAIMNDALRSANLLPTIEPYSALGYVYVGSSPGATIPPALLSITGNDAVVDWLVVELRNPVIPSQIVHSRPALLQRDGDVIGTDGDPYVTFPVAAGNYHVALRHRNHLGLMAGALQVLGPVSQRLDLRLNNTSVFGGTNARTWSGGVYCLWAGDATGNGTLSYIGINNDRDPILTAVGGTTPNNSLTNVYDRRDVNLDGVIRYTGTNNDRDPILTNVGSTTPNNTRTQQLP